MAQRNPPLAGRPPFATNEPDSAFVNHQPQRRIKPDANLNPNSRTSAYDVYDNYLDDSNRNSGIGALGFGFMNADMDDDDDDDDEVFTPAQKAKQQAVPASSQKSAPAPASPIRAPAPVTPPAPAPAPARAPVVTFAPPVQVHPQPGQATIPLAAPRPGYAAPIAALNLARPSPTASPTMRMPPPAMTIQIPPPSVHAPGPGTPCSSVPSTPHPLLPPMTPIMPAFARPAKSPAPRENVKFATMDPIMRSNSEDVLLPKRGDRGDDFWRRFSTIAKEENKKPPKMKESSWLRKTQNGSTRLTRWVWAGAIIILLCIGGGVALRIVTSHNQNPNQQPMALGGSANETSSSVAPKSTSSHRHSSSSGLPHVSPTNTVARRVAIPEAFPTGLSIRHRQIPDHPRYHRGRFVESSVPQ